MRFVRFVFVAFLAVAVTGARSEYDAPSNQVQEAGEGRTFGHHFLKRLSFAMIPIMYKLGMMTTLMITLTIMSTKGLAVGVLLLVLAISQIIARGYGTPQPAATYAAAPAVYPVVHAAAAQVPYVHKAVQVHAAHVQPYAAAWHANPYAREDTEQEPEYVKQK